VPQPLNPQTLNVLYAFGNLQVPPPAELLRVLARQACVKEAELKPQELANILWAWASLGLNTMHTSHALIEVLEPKPKP
jgi:hypothetical protein